VAPAGDGSLFVGISRIRLAFTEIPHAILAVLVFLDLLECDAELFTKLSLVHAATFAKHPDP
jgi:hypothetical protein